MKKSCSNFLLTPLKVGMPVLAVVCFAITDPVTAAEKSPVQISVQKEVKARSKEFQEILKDLTDVENMAKVEEGKTVDFPAAFAKLKSIEQKLKTKIVELKGDREAILYYQSVEKRFKETHAAFGVLAAESKLQQAKKLYEEAAKAGVSSDSASKADEAKNLADDACYTYYVAPLDPNAGRDPELLDKLINTKNQGFSVRVAQLKAACEKIIKAFEFRVQTDTAAVDPNYANRMEKINKLYARASNLYRDAQYTQARDICEQIYIEDPCNAKASALLDKIYKKLYFYSELRAYNEVLRSDAESIWLWSNAVPASGNRVATEQKREVKDSLMEKLNSWKISVAFADYSIKDAITMIREKSQEVDPRKAGVNFLERGISGTDTENISITLELDNVPISVVLNYLCKKAGISWKTSEAFVLYGHGISDYETTEIPMRNSVYHSITSANEEGGEESKDDGDAWDTRGLDSTAKTISGAAGKKRGAVSDTKLRAFFADRGIPFDDHSSVIYNPKTHKLAVTNTRENLQKLELLVRELDVETPLVLIESKILEISVNDEEELGFDWTATYTNDKNSSYDFAFGSPLRSVAPSAVDAVEGIVNDKLINNLNIIPNMNLNGGHQLNFYLTVSAVDRTDRLEQLSTPKVVVKSGDTAVIKMIKSMYFPDSWESPDTEIDDGDVAMETSYPEFSDPDEVGIQFTVTPTVSSNKYTVQLDLEPSITDLTGWTDYSYDMVIRRNPLEDEDLDTENPDGGTPVLASNLVTTVDLFRVNIKMPEISKRELITKLKCFDAQTMMVGGMVLDKQISMEDRYPILGDLPIIGRFFTKTANTSARSNLLISVSPRLISGDGVPINSRPDNGIPDFRFRK